MRSKKLVIDSNFVHDKLLYFVTKVLVLIFMHYNLAWPSVRNFCFYLPLFSLFIPFSL